jgi:tetratricopeptide (TPR) repeat protein
VDGCPSREQLQQLLAEQLTEDVRVLIEDHVEACTACAEILARVSDETETIDWQNLSRRRAVPAADSDAAIARHLKENPPERTGPAPEGEAIGFEVGQAISHYRILEKLGGGGMGVVYKAHDSRLGRSVALKFLPEDYGQDRQRLQRFQREARTASALNHPHICTIHDVDEFEGRPFLVMELIEGQTLRSRAVQHRSLPALLPLLGQVAKALAAAHAAGIVHRDIKPENIMVRDDGYAKVVDFGLARSLPSGGVLSETKAAGITDPGTWMGTVRYMSPEQARAEPASSASDIFSLGIVLYELATGRHPFPADSRVGILHGIISQAPLRPSLLNPQIPALLEALILHMLEKDARLRPSAAEVDAVLTELSGRDASVLSAPALGLVQRHTVGRQPELAELRAGFQSAASGKGLLLCVAGEPGIGKTTLVEEFLQELAAGNRTYRLASGRCSERLAGAEAYLPFLEALDSLLHGGGGEAVAQVMKVVAPTWYVQVTPLTGDDSSFARVREEAKVASQERLKRELAAFLHEVARLEPLVLFLDDVHWADASTVDLLAYVGSKCAAMRLLLVLSYRPSDLLLRQHPFLSVKMELQGRGVCREILLGFLSRPDLERYLALEFPEHGFPAPFAALIHARTEGNPLFMVDLLRYLRERGVIAQEQGRWTLTQSVAEVQQELPESVRTMIQRKIDQLSEADRRLLVAASVQGYEFDAAVVAKALALEAVEVEERLEGLERVHAFVRRLAEREFPDNTLTLRYRFVHVLYQNALYALLTPARKGSLSTAVAEALLGHYGEQSTAVASELALLFEAGRDFARAADYFVVAAQNAARVYGTQEAMALLGRALANADKLRGPAGQSRILAVVLQRVPLHMTLARFDDAIADCERAEKVAEETGNREAQINAICGKAIALFFLKRLAETQQYGNQAAELARLVESRIGLASAEGVLASHSLCTGDLAAAENYFDRAIPVLKEEGEPLSALDAGCYHATLLTFRLEHQKAEQTLRWAQQKAHDLGAGFHLIMAHFVSGMALGNQGRLSEALGMVREGMRLAELNGEHLWLPRLPNTLGWLHRELQDLETAVRLDAESARLGREFGIAEAEANAQVNLGHNYLVLGEPARAIEHLQEAKRLYDQDVWYRWRYNLRLQAELASYWIIRGDLKVAATHAAAALQGAEATCSRKYIAWAHKLLGDIAALEERVEDGQRHYVTALGVLQNHPCPTVEWKILKAAAELARRQRDDAVGAEFFGRARAVVHSLADAIQDDKLRQTFLAAKPVQDLSL